MLVESWQCGKLINKKKFNSKHLISNNHHTFLHRKLINFSCNGIRIDSKLFQHFLNKITTLTLYIWPDGNEQKMDREYTHTGNIIEAKENVEKCILDRETMNSFGFLYFLFRCCCCRYGLWEIRKFRALGIRKCYINVYTRQSFYSDSCCPHLPLIWNIYMRSRIYMFC